MTPGLPDDRVTVWISGELLPMRFTLVFQDHIPDGFVVSEGYRVPRWLASQWQATLSLLDSMEHQVDLMIMEAGMAVTKTDGADGAAETIPDGPMPTADHPAVHTFQVTHRIKAEGADTPFAIFTDIERDVDGAIGFIRDRLLHS
jgi:hypothetical protein